MSSPDIIERLRKDNLEQFLILVRMHLSFVVDICTDDVDGSTEKPKQFRWNFKKAMSLVNNSSQNNAKSTVEVSITEEGMSRVYELIDFLSIEENVKQEGIFRRTGSLTRQQELRQLLLNGSSLDLDQGRFSVHDCASVLKGFIAELPQPLLMDQYYQTYCTLAAQYPPNLESSEAKLLTALQLLLLLLTPLHQAFLKRLLALLRKAADNEESNRMSPDTLATMFTPHLMCPRKLSPETFHENAVALSPLVSFMIRHSSALFVPPSPLKTDAGAYYAARARREQPGLDESVTDRTAANTVYTFVDRNRTNAENSSNPTDTALAQLYAHIQSLPPSHHKRRLIKQFNRQNGYGTPIQVQRTGKAAGSRSFGDSIKRHIFNKGLLNKTPKKGSGTNINSVEEKANKDKIQLTNADKSEVLQKNVVLKNLASKMASIDCVDGDVDFDSDASNESTLSDGALSQSKKRSPKFVSEPNLSLLDSETPKNTKKRGTRLFRSKILSASQNLNKRYQKRNTVKGTPTCVSCFEQETSENDISESDPIGETPTKCRPIREQDDVPQMKYLTSTPGVPDMVFEENTDYVINFRRASMSPITKSTQKLSKAMQESIMTPRSRKPLIITSEQRDSLPEKETTAELSKNSIYQSLSPKNDSDFVSSEDETRSRYSESNNSETHFVSANTRPELNVTMSENTETKSLTEPFREYLLSRSVLTATPVDLSILNKTDDAMTDSLMYCLNGNNPSDLTSSINNLAVDRMDTRSPLKNLNFSPNRKRGCPKDLDASENKKAFIEKENDVKFELRETEL